MGEKSTLAKRKSNKNNQMGEKVGETFSPFAGSPVVQDEKQLKSIAVMPVRKSATGKIWRLCNLNKVFAVAEFRSNKHNYHPGY